MTTLLDFSERLPTVTCPEGEVLMPEGGRTGLLYILVDGEIEILKGDAYVRSLAVLVLVSTVALTLGDYVFKSAVARAIPPAELGAFLRALAHQCGATALALSMHTHLVAAAGTHLAPSGDRRCAGAGGIRA